jgi:2-succinyl-6-hydroxy-2,4-cyclohexadiene-1-carboxylate synthase
MTRIAVSALEGALVNVEQNGNGPVVVVLHGFTGSTKTWRSFMDAARSDYTLIAVDLLGHGDSDSPDDPELYSMERHVQALIEILDGLGLQRVAWLGYSLGGRVALSVAIAYPERTLALVLESALPGLARLEERKVRVREDEMLADWIEEVGIDRFVGYWESLPLWDSQTRLPMEVRKELRHRRLHNDPRGLANSLRGVGAGAQPALHDRLHRFSAPMLIVAGEDDIRFSAIAREMELATSQSQLQILPGTGHAAHLEQPDRFNRTVMDFLKTALAASPSLTTHPRSR